MKIRISFWKTSQVTKLNINDDKSGLFLNKADISKTANTHESLVKSFVTAERTSKAFCKAFGDNGTGHYAYAGFKEAQLKNYVVWINDELTHGKICLRDNGVKTFNFSLSVGGTADNPVYYTTIFTEAEIETEETLETGLETVASIVNIMKSKDDQLAKALAKIEALEATIERLKSEKRVRLNIEENHDKETSLHVEKTMNELDEMSGLTEEAKQKSDLNAVYSRIEMNTDYVFEESLIELQNSDINKTIETHGSTKPIN